MTNHSQLSPTGAQPWWQTTVFYQIYPRSFADSNGDGIGDLAGINSRLDYLQDLGIGAIWLSPHYPSPLLDCGYDVADYTGVAPEYGTLDDFTHFLDAAHQRDIRVVLDLVLNHTSDQHPWFQDARRGRQQPHHDWYVWHPGRDGGPPNNWNSAFGGSAWEFVPELGLYYYHYFLKQQPDLNWRHPAVRQAMFAAARFWLDLGVDGFRLDAINTLFEDPALTDHTTQMSQRDLFALMALASSDEQRQQVVEQWRLMYQHQVDQPGVHALMSDLRTMIDAYPGAMLVGETDDIAYMGNGHNELHLVFNFPLMQTERLTPAWVRANQAARLTALPAGGWPCNTLGNHDSSRVYTRFGNGKHDAALARLSAALVLTLQGTPFLYNGEEIGMTDLLLDDVSQFRDLLGLQLYQMAHAEFGLPAEVAVAHAAHHGRDKCRTPLQWTPAPQAGFCPPSVQPWLPVNPNAAQVVNVAEQADDPASLLNFYRRLLAVRRQTPALQTGAYVPLHESADTYLAFLRQLDQPETSCLVVLNMADQAQDLTFDLAAGQVQCLFSSHERPAGPQALRHLTLAPFEVFIGALNRKSQVRL
ncbi:MAG: alpha-glucosidase [Anaerolineae bacterium]